MAVLSELKTSSRFIYPLVVARTGTRQGIFFVPYEKRRSSAQKDAPLQEERRPPGAAASS
jgi:hypothetical protein